MSESEDEDDYSFYGTGLDPIEEDEVPKKKPFALENQVVLDKQGKRRFHGAFTGGFSAGFCNTVGSSEGWTPAAFKSSRSEKASLQAQKAEDFMDDEDTGEFGFAPRVLRATADYRDTKSSRKRGHIQPSQGPIPGKPVMFDLLKPSRETVGARLLRQMGWKPGQGVGPRLSHKEKKDQQRDIHANKSKVYGCTLPSQGNSKHARSDGEDSNKDDDDEHTPYEVTFAPDDYDPFLVKPKMDRFGIGYSGLDKRPVLSGHVNLFEPSFLGMEEKKRKVAISGQAFGVGALEEEDEDIYARDDMSQYDFALETSASIAASKRAERDAQKQKMLNSSGFRGDALEGFKPAKQPLQSQRKFFPPPVLPNDFVPSHSIRKSRFETDDSNVANEAASRRQGLQRHELNASSRASIIGEPVRYPVQPTSVQKAVETEKPAEPIPVQKPTVPAPAQGPVESSRAPSQVTPQIKTEPLATTSISSSFRPFAQNPQKQARYEQFVDLSKRGLKDTFASLQPSSMTEWDKEQEKSEFEQAARIYKPLTGFMSDRFVSASQPDDNLNPLSTVEKTQHGSEEMRGAAKMKMFGKLTRRTTNWNPCALLCKRFNVPQPAHCAVPETKSKARFSVFDYLDSASHNTSSSVPDPDDSSDWRPDREIKQEPVEEASPRQSTSGTCGVASPPAATPPATTTRPKSRWDVPHKTPRQDEMPVSNPSNIPKPILTDIEFPEPPVKADLFKAIFLSSSEDSESEDEEPQGKSSNSQRDRSDSDSSSQPTPAKSVVRNMSPPRGIFANLDLDAINARRASKVNEPPAKEGDKSVSPSEDSESEEEMMYGPKLPINNPAPSRTHSLAAPASPVRSKEKWVEKDSREKHHKHSKHKKEKKHKKHKSKKHKRKR